MIELLEAKPQKKSQLKSETYFADLIKLLPPEHKARWLSGAAINNADQAALSVISTALSRLNSLIDTETEQILCFNTAIDTETLCKEKCAVFIVLPEEDRTKYVIANLIIEQISREIYHIADENGGHLDKRIMIYFEEFGTMPPISGVEAMFSALRSRSVSIVAIIQSFAQLEKNYGKQGSEIIVDNTRVMPISSAANLYPLNYSGKTDEKGLYIGKDKYGSSICVDFDVRSDDKTNSNIVILGNAGEGKSFLLKLILTNLRESGFDILNIDPNVEYVELTND